MKKRRGWMGAALLAGGVAVLGYAGCSMLGGGDSETTEDPGLLLGRPWVDSKPSRPTDHVHMLLTVPKRPIGVFFHGSSFAFRGEVFRFERVGGELRLVFPQSDRRATVTYTVRGCSDLPPYDLCLDLNDNPWGGPRRYYSRRVVRRGDQPAAGLEAWIDAQGEAALSED